MPPYQIKLADIEKSIDLIIRIGQPLKKWSKSRDLRGEAWIYLSKIAGRHGNIKILGMKEPRSLDDIYIKANVREKLTIQLGLDPEDLEAWENRISGERRIIHEKMDALEVARKHQFLMLLGQPGAGKTTFLRYLTLKAAKGELGTERLPIFISLKDWADSYREYPDLTDFLTYEFDVCGFPEAKPFVEKSLEDGKLMILLDGLDEISGSPDFGNLQTRIRDFADKYDENQFIISCRVAAYNHFFTKFADAEVADFDENQSEGFIKLWFMDDTSLGNRCIDELKKQEHAPLKEMVKNPLLLTLICLAFERNLHFPSKRRAELYKNALEALLREWDSSRKIKRAEIYRDLTTDRKEDLFSELAYPWFQENHYFVRQQEAEEGIAGFIRNLPEVEEDKVKVDSRAVLKGIEAQHGILVKRADQVYSFAHLSFQEYYTARYFKENPDNLDSLLEHLTDRRWREVFILTGELFSKGDRLLLKMLAQAESLVAGEPKIKKLLAWSTKKTLSVNLPPDNFLRKCYSIS